MTITTARHRLRRAALMGVVALATTVTAPAAAHAGDLPPAPVKPGFEDVVIAARPVSDPARPAATTGASATAHRAVAPVARTRRPVVTTSAATQKTSTVRVCARTTVRVRGVKTSRRGCVNTTAPTKTPTTGRTSTATARATTTTRH